MKLIKLERVLFGSFLVSLCVPLSYSFGTAWSRIYFWDFLLLPIYICWFLRLSIGSKLDKNITVHANPIDFILVFLLFWFLVCDILGFRVGASMYAWFLWFRCFLIYFYISRNVGKIVQINQVILGLVFIVLLEGTLCLIQFSTNSNFGQLTQYFGEFDPLSVRKFNYMGITWVRAMGTFWNTGVVAEWIVLILPILLSVYFLRLKHFGWITVVVFVGILGALSTLSRTEIVFLFVSILFVLFYHRYIGFALNIRTIKFAVFLGVILVLIFIILEKEGLFLPIVERFKDIEGRFEKKGAYMISALKIMDSRPLLGVGQRNFGLLLDSTGFEYFHRGKGVVHNIPLLIGCEAGYPGLFLFLGLMIYIFFRTGKYLLKKPSNLFEATTGGALIGLSCYLLALQLGAGLTYHGTAALFHVCLGLVNVAGRKC